MSGLTLAVAAALDFNRRHKTAQSIHEHRPDGDVEFTDRDQRTLVSE